MTGYIETHYTRDGTVYYNGRPANRMGMPGTPSAKILALLEDGETRTPHAVAEALKLKRYTALNTLYRLYERGMVERLDNPIRYRRKA